MERVLIKDPKKFDGKPIGGRLDYRGLITIIAIAVVVAPVCWLAWTLRWNVYAASALAALPALPIGILGFKTSHGMHLETFLPIVVAERLRPVEMRWEQPGFRFSGNLSDPPAPKPSRRERGRARGKARMSAYEDHLYALAIARASEPGDGKNGR